MKQKPTNDEKTGNPSYVLDEQVGYVLRRVTQRHLAIFSEIIPEVTTTQFAVLARLSQMGALSQNHLGRATAMDAATIKGVVDRLARQGYVTTTPNTQDRRRLNVELTPKGVGLVKDRMSDGVRVSDKTLEPLSAEERAQFLALLTRLS